jgi:hypothetical protein
MKRCSFCGRENDATAASCRECGTLFSNVPTTAPDPRPLPAPKLIDVAALEPAIDLADGFHHADWQFIQQWIISHVAPENTEAAWNEAVLLWLGKVRVDLGGGYFILQSPKAVLLCELPLEKAEWLLGATDSAADTIRIRLGKTAWRHSFGKRVVLLFSEQDDYYQYLSHFSRDGEQASSGGVCIHSGCTHIAIPWQDEAEALNAVVHELTHDCLAHLPLPLWLNEAVSVTLQKAIAPAVQPVGRSEQDALFSASINWQVPIMWDELAERHFGFWNETNIQSFWAGTSFFEPGDPNELSYSLAEVLLKLLTERGDAKAMQDFIEAAQQDDAGQTAALDCLGADLGEIAGTFLGAGNWRPNRAAMVTQWNEAGWKQSS